MPEKIDVERIDRKIRLLRDTAEELNRLSEGFPAIEEELENQLRLKTNLGYAIEICGFGTLPRYEVKARRFKDLR